MKNFNDTIGNRNRDLLTCSAVPQPTALPRAPFPLGRNILHFVPIVRHMVECFHLGISPCQDS